MATWIIEPRDPLIVRDGRPFGPNPGARARSLSFPFPATLAGGVRTLAGQDEKGSFDASDETIAAVKEIGIRGPLLVEIDQNDNIQWMAPAPADALLLQDQKTKIVGRYWVQPLALPADAETDLPADLSYVAGLPEPNPDKPYKDAPRFWVWDSFEKWLIDPQSEQSMPARLGHNGPQPDRRMHVAIDPRTSTGRDGDLFLTSGLTFSHPQNDSDEEINLLSSVRRLALGLTVENLNGRTLTAGFSPLGGERRMVNWQPSNDSLPQLPNGLVDEIVSTKHCRLILLTPAYFEAGWRPHDLLQPAAGVTPALKAAVVGKPQTISGWDFETKRPKPTRRLAPAGSVYFLELQTDDPENIRAWLEKCWMHCVSDGRENRLAGFGLAAVGTWSGQPAAVTLEEEENDA